MVTYPKRANLRALFLALVIGAGALLVWVVGATWTTTIVEQRLSRSQPYVSLTITNKGEPLLTWVEYDPPKRIQQYRTLDGRPANYDGVSSARSAVLQRAPDKPELLSWSQRIAAFSAGTSERREAWYLVHDGAELGGHAYFVGYDDRTKSRLGYFSRAGFRMNLPPDQEQFLVDRPLGYYSGGYATAPAARLSINSPASHTETASDTLAYLVDEKGLFVVNLDQRSVTQANLPGKALAVAYFSVPITVKSVPDEGGEERIVELNEDRVLVRLPERIEMQDRQGRTLLSTPVPEAARDALLGYNLCDDNRVVLEVSEGFARRTPELYWFDAEGKLERQQRVQLPPYWNENLGSMSWVPAIVCPTPAILGALVWLAPRNFTTFDLLPAVFLILVLSIVASVLVYRHVRRYAQGGAAVWAVFALAFGLPGLVGYWLHRSWPHRERCPNCAAIVPRDRLKCAACEANFLPPAQFGIEVFA